MTLHAGGGIVPSPARPAIPGGFRPKVHFTVDSACFSSYGLRCGRLQAFVTKAGVRACVCAFLWRFRLFASSIVCALSPQVFFFRLGANFKGDRILVLFFYFPPSNTISCSCASPSFCGPYGQRRIVYESLDTHLVKLLTRFLARVTHPLCISVCVCVCRPSSLDSTLYVYFTRGKNILKTGKESSDLHLEKCYALYGVTLPDNSNFDN